MVAEDIKECFNIQKIIKTGFQYDAYHGRLRHLYDPG